MKTKLLSLLMLAGFLMLFTSCGKDESSVDLGGNQSPFGEVGNTIDWTVGQFGITESEMYVTELENGISTFMCSATASSNEFVEILKLIPTNQIPGTLSFIGNSVEATITAKITDEGMQAVYDDGTKFTLVKYDADVGDKYTATVGGTTLENEVMAKSSEDDYFWQGLLIKVVEVRFKSTIPGISYIDHVYNHKFGLVGVAVHFEDGTVKYAGVEC